MQCFTIVTKTFFQGGCPVERLKKAPRPKSVPEEPFTEVKEGLYYHENLDELRSQLLSAGHPVTASVSAPHQLKALRIPTFRGKFCVIQSVPENQQELKDFCERLSALANTEIPYRNESMPMCTQRCLLTLLQQKRQYLSPAQKAELLKEQGYKCNQCGDRLERGAQEADHIVPLCRTIKGQTFQYLCSSCHELKS